MAEALQNNILFVPIQINGGNGLPSNLLDRELYIKFDTQSGAIDGLLYVGKEGSYIPVAVEYSKETGLIKHDDDYFFLSKHSDEGQHSRIASFQINEAQLLGYDDKIPTISNLKISDLHKLSITKEMYGKTTPSTGTPGQIFFKL